MVKVETHGITYYMDGYLKTNLDQMKEVIKDDWDFIICIDGLERSGKSAFAQQIAHYVSTKPLTLDNICFNAQELTEIIWKAQPGEAIIYDEAGQEGMTAAEWMTGINKALKKNFQVIGQKNLFIIVVLPVFFELQKYYAMHRSAFIINVHTSEVNGKVYQRGFFKAYNRDAKRRLYVLGRKEWDYSVAKPTFFGRFGFVDVPAKNPYVVDREAYKRKKAMVGKSEVMDKVTARWKERASLLMRHLRNNGMILEDVGKIANCGKDTVSDSVAELEVLNLHEVGEPSAKLEE